MLKLIFVALLPWCTALKTGRELCIGNIIPDTDACGGGVVAGCAKKYVKVGSRYAQCKEVDGNCLTAELCTPGPNIQKVCYEANTPNNAKYTGDHWKLADGDKKQVAFTVKSKNDAHVSFFNSKKELGNRYEIVIGGAGDRISWIRKCTRNRCHNRHELRKKGFNGALSQEKEFWATCEKGKIQWGTGLVVGQQMQQEWSDSSAMECAYADVRTGWGSTGHWNFCVLGSNKACHQGVFTPDSRRYLGSHWMLPIGTEKKVTFKVKAKNDAHVGFFSHLKSTRKDMYEIVIGGWGNGQSVIRQCNQCRNEVVKRTPNVNNLAGREFWATCNDDGTVRWGTGSTIGESLMQEFKGKHGCKFLDLMTGWGSSGTWDFCMLA